MKSGLTDAPRPAWTNRPRSVRVRSGSFRLRPESRHASSTAAQRIAASASDELPLEGRQAYLDLNHALGLPSEGVDGPPDGDREGFDPDDSFELANEEGANCGGGSLGGLLGPLRQLSYWTMTKRARTVGESGMHDFVKALQGAAYARIN